MADRYWVGGSGTWNTTSTTNWSTASGGGSGASVPTVSDNVIFDQAGTYTVTMTGALACLDITVSAGTVTFATGTSPTLNIRGSMTLVAGTLWSSTGTITFSSTTTGRTITTNGVTINATTTFSGVGGGWTLGSALTTAGSRDLTLTAGTFNTGNYNMTLTGGRILITGSNTKALNLGSSTISLAYWYDLNTSNTTVNAGTSSITITATNASTIGLGGRTFYDVTFSSTTTLPDSQSASFGNFRNLTFAAPTQFRSMSFPASFTVSGTLTLTAGTIVAYRTALYSATIGTTITITCAAFSGNNVDFRDITIAGAAAPISGTSLGDCKGNSGITFTSAKTVYWNLAAGGNWNATAWATTSAGTPLDANFPLPQDTCVFSGTTASLSDGATVTFDSLSPTYVGTLDMSARTTTSYDMVLIVTPTLSGVFPNFGVQVYGNLIFGTGCTFGGTAANRNFGFYGRTTQLFTSAGVTSAAGITVNAPSTIVTLQDAFTCSKSATDAVSVVRGTFDANDYNVTLSGALGGVTGNSGTATRTIAVSSSTWTISGTSPWTVSSTGLTITGTGTISLNNASTKLFDGGSSGNYSNITLNNSGAGFLQFVNPITIGTLSNSVQPTGFSFLYLNTTTINNWNVSGTAGNLVTIQSNYYAPVPTGVGHALSKSTGIVSADYLSISFSSASGGAGWYAGANSIDGGNNSGWIFTAAPSPVLYAGNFFMLM